MNEFPLLKTSRLLFNKILLNDAENIIELYSKQNNIVFFDNKKIKDIQEAKKYINYWNNRYEKNKSIRWALTLKCGRFIGIAGFNFINEHYGTIACCININHWNKGYANEVTKEILNFGFKVLNLNRIEADHFSENIASGTVLLKNNFTKEGIIREKRFENNKYHDVIVYGILKSEWESTT